VNLRLGTLPAEKDVRAELGGGEEKGATLTALGIDVVPASQMRGGAGGEGLYVTNVNPEGPAAQKGLRRGDMILEAGGKPLEARADLVQVFDAARKEGRKAVLLRVKSSEGTRFVALPATGS
jgi:serine protease Do